MTTHRPVMVAVGGDSGTGKTTLVSGLVRIFGAERISTISLDDYHLLDREARRRAGVTALDPAANDIGLMVDHLRRLRRGEAVAKPTYDHSTGTFGPAEALVPAEIVIVRGLFPLFNEELRAAFDVRIWLDPQEELKWSWKVRRDCAQRGYSVPEVIRQIVERRADQLAHIAPQIAHADLVIRFHPPAGYFRPGVGGEHDDGHLNVRIHVDGRLQRLDLDDVLAAAGRGGRPAIRLVETEGAFARGDGRGLALEIDGTVSPDVAGELERRVWAHIGAHRYLRPDEVGDYLDGATTRHSDPLGLTQLLVAYQVVRAERDRDAGIGGEAARPAGARAVRGGPAREGQAIAS